MKKMYANILMTGLLCSCALNANAFEYASSETGFSLNVPDQNIMVISENMFAAENRIFDIDKKVVKTSGMHMVTGLTAAQIKQNFGTNFTTEKFNADLQGIKTALKTNKNPRQSDDYKYLAQAAAGAYVNYSGDDADLAGILQLNKQFAGMAQINKTAIENIGGKNALLVESSIQDIAFELKLPLKKSELFAQDEADKAQLAKANEQGMKVSFTDDGYMLARFDNIYNIKEKTYLMSANDNLYAVNSLYVSADNLPGVESLYKLDTKAFNKFNKELVKGLTFTEPAPQTEKALTINDTVSGRKLQLPEKWLYTQTDFSSIYGIDKGGFELTAYSALPETSLDAADKAIKTFGISFDKETNTLKMDLSQFTMPDLLDLFDEGIIMASGNFNGVAQIEPDFAQYVDEYKVIFKNPAFTKTVFNDAMNQVFNSLSPEDIAAIEKYLKAENFNYTFDINNYNARFNCDADLKAHIPDIFKVLQEANVIAGNTATAEEAAGSLSKDKVFAMLDTNLVPFNCYFKNQLYFDRSQRFNNLLYFTKGDKATANQQIMQQFNTTDLYLY